MVFVVLRIRFGVYGRHDAFSYDISTQLGNLLQEYGNSLDIIYDDEVDYSSLGYEKFIFWNGTIVFG
jgi:hypothetical protein